MTTLLRSAHFVVQHHVASSYIQVIRTEEPFLRLDVAARAWSACEQALEGLDRDATGLLLDFRRAPMSTDPELDKLLVMHRDVLAIPFARSAILVATYVGVMQTDRLSRSYSRIELKIFHDEVAAVSFVSKS